MYRRSSVRTVYDASHRREPGYHQAVYVPLNYAGTAIGSPPPDGVAPATGGVALPTPPELPNEKGMAEAVPLREADEPEEALRTRSSEKSAEETGAPPTADRPKGQGSLLSGLLSGQHFPFGHGLGYEELLILGLILFLLREGDGSEDDDLSVTLLLLGALLFCG